MLISELGELALLKRVRDLFSIDNSRVVVSIGDDAAIFKAGKGNAVVTTDLMVEGVHFDYAIMTFYHVGFKLITSNVSDIYAMGGIPDYVFLNIAMPGNRTEEEFDDLLGGVGDACRYYGIKVLGGDMSSSIKGDFYSATVLGSADKPVLRSSAKIGDKIFITGTTGDSAAGLAYLKNISKRIPLERGGRIPGEHPDDHIMESVRRHILPEARNPGKIIEKANAMIDVSDGLLIDIYRLCSESRVGAVLFRDSIPVSDGVKSIASMLDKDYMDYVLSGGEDYELLITAEHEELEGCVLIGEIIDEGFFMTDSSGKKEKFSPRGFTHFKDTGKI